MAVKKEFLTIEPEFPPKAWVALIMFKKDLGPRMMLSIGLVFRGKKSFKRVMKSTEKQLLKEKITLEGAIVFRIKLKEKFPLKKEYWQQPTQDYSGVIRTKAMMKVARQPKLYKLLVLPRYYSQKSQTWIFEAASPFFVTAETSAIEQFMLTSRDVVDVRAKSAAIYSFEKAYGYDWINQAWRSEVTIEDDLEKN
jgi:hypothetical protein